MLFTSPFFLFIFLPAVLFLYFISPRKIKNLSLLILSLLFYYWSESELVILLLLSAIVDYTSGLIIDSGKRRIGLTISILFNVSILVYFKYSHFFVSSIIESLNGIGLSISESNQFLNVALPLGISFYTFQTMSYTIDVYYGKVKATKNFLNFATYVTLFPQLIAGPIVRYSQIENELKSRQVSMSLFASGVERFIIGLAKKVIIANNCAYLVDGIFNMPHNEMSPLIAWIGVIAYSIQIYFDFAGYSDMAIGLGKMLGFNFPENFNFPYIAKSIREFWKRWHMTLSSWFKDYLYIPLGGNRVNKNRTYINLVIVFFITGLWHGANWTFIIWGLFHGLFIVLERAGLQNRLKKLPSLVSHTYLILIVLLSWVFFRSETIGDALLYLKSMFNFSIDTNYEFLKFYMSTETCFALILGILFSTTIFKNLYHNKISTVWLKSEPLLQSFKILTLLVLFVICFFYISIDSYNPFIYFRF